MVAKIKDACKNCGHSRAYHGIAEAHELGTTHCTAVSVNNVYCHCQEFLVGE